MSYSNNSQKKALKNSIKEDKLAHAYIISGSDSESRSIFINRTLKEIFCENKQEAPCDNCSSCHKIDNGNMEDIIYVNKNGNSIKVDQIKELSVALTNKPFTTRTVAVINDSDTMTPESQNKLLKNLEEPAPGTVIILSADNQFSLFPTIRSRCVVINMGSALVMTDPVLEEKAQNIVRYSMMDKPLNTIFEQVKECVDNNSEAAKLLDALEIFVRDVTVGRYSMDLLMSPSSRKAAEKIDWSKGYPFNKYLKHIENAKTDLKRNINWKYTIKDLIINFKQEELNG